MPKSAVTYERKIGDFSYQSEKFTVVRRVLMEPHSRDEVSKLVGAFNECQLGLRGIEKSERLQSALDDDARRDIDFVQQTLNTDGIEPDEHGDGTWAAKIRRMSEQDKSDFAGAVDRLATWFHDAFYETHSRNQ